ncbi:argininosuccinate synthase domain-containing protein [Actinosynnema sp. NPDC047251]|uniref:Arginosuccinate synthase-like N-terminal domain-containing protein n=1 Tax=Saccharothrix espanaensis (strain ATCC 51144 / DSM 44229 / JCM 9112 / NBRC 15066 / NRRL 15764) TaxID=1179773 RepID=K0K8G0_SACES|nr:argininosuccinate synthase domain-containing protein [Saccharothrix espanaensis]CCH33832.1 hypothetical protein BN6_65950 [Saccharothrix espanaensis DSM 44229]
MTDLVVLAGPSDDRFAEGAVVVVDLGQDEDPGTARGTAEVVEVDARDEFAQRYGLPALQAGASHPDLVPALSQPLTAHHVVRVARHRGATAVAEQEVRVLTAPPVVPRPAHPNDHHELVVTFDHGVPVALDGETVTARPAVQELDLRAGGRHRERFDARSPWPRPTGGGKTSPWNPTSPASSGRPAGAGVSWCSPGSGSRWSAPLEQALDGVLDAARQHVCGEVRVLLPGGPAEVRPAAERGGHPLHQTVAKGFVQL